MNRVAFKMKLIKGKEEEYRKRHDEIWAELKQLLKETGISAYSIFLDESTCDLFAILHIENKEQLDLLPGREIMRKWWDYMQDLMETHDNNAPVTTPLKEVFYLP